MPREISNVIFSENDLVEDVKNAVFSILGLEKEEVCCDISIFGQSISSQKRQRSLLQLSIKSNTTIEARLRWI
ncbi:unnamed protein product (macronuclear) [Paramecium tetraurelia]|uniref:Ubiquitin-like domain-containing protein n=1 Tax=Paramecium tetraurelia TaxID=5888 RepID=A0DA54_PARTE|nr:uncharacterized protein GSPATT00039371001 [Paramecium tetraurelia]CAK79921.1 unnamed protein product [Paramecium tetraurelia]|eukprot:XP_001447318.1 hypothetical protein (macronuclear) [Paramecium tetraurelia strain d4-2]